MRAAGCSPHGERFRHRRRLHVRRVLPRYFRGDRPLRLRRHALLGRLPGRLARRAPARGGTRPQLRQVHPRRRGGGPHGGAPGSDRGGDVVRHRLRALPGGPDGGGGQPRRTVPRRDERRRTVLDGHRCRGAHGGLRVARRHARHHVDPDRQGRTADGGHRGAHRARPGPLPRKLQRVAQLRRRPQRVRQGVPLARTALRRKLDGAHRLHQPGAGPGARHGGPSAHPVPLLHRAHGPCGPAVRRLVHRPHRQLLPDDDRARVRSGGSGRIRRGTGVESRREHGRSAACPGPRRR